MYLPLENLAEKVNSNLQALKYDTNKLTFAYLIFWSSLIKVFPLFKMK